MSEKFEDIKNWAAVVGVWEFSNGRCLYKSSDEPPETPHGICVSNVLFSEGTARATTCFADLGNGVEVSSRLVFGWRSRAHPYLSIGLGGAGRAYSVYQFHPALAWQGVAFAGSRENLIANHPYKLSVRVQGQTVRLEVDSVQVLEHVLDTPLPRGQFGLFAWGTSSVEFTSISVSPEPARRLSDALILRPGAWGMGIDLPKAWDWVREKWRRRGDS